MLGMKIAPLLVTKSLRLGNGATEKWPPVVDD